MDTLYFTKIGIVIFTFEEMAKEVFVKIGNFKRNSIAVFFKHVFTILCSDAKDMFCQ